MIGFDIVLSTCGKFCYGAFEAGVEAGRRNPKTSVDNFVTLPWRVLHFSVGTHPSEPTPGALLVDIEITPGPLRVEALLRKLLRYAKSAINN